MRGCVGLCKCSEVCSYTTYIHLNISHDTELINGAMYVASASPLKNQTLPFGCGNVWPAISARFMVYLAFVHKHLVSEANRVIGIG